MNENNNTENNNTENSNTENSTCESPSAWESWKQQRRTEKPSPDFTDRVMEEVHAIEVVERNTATEANFDAARNSSSPLLTVLATTAAMLVFVARLAHLFSILYP